MSPRKPEHKDRRYHQHAFYMRFKQLFIVAIRHKGVAVMLSLAVIAASGSAAIYFSGVRFPDLPVDQGSSSD